MRAIDPATMRRLMLHEARVHAVPGRHLRDLGDAILLHDDTEPEPFWNRLESVRWSADTAGFDRRLTEVLLIFASLGRQPHIWASPLHDAPIDLVARLKANGFRDLGAGNLMALADPEPARLAASAPIPAGVTVERLAGLAEAEAEFGGGRDRRRPARGLRCRVGAAARGRGRDHGLAGASVVHPLPRAARRSAGRRGATSDLRGCQLPVVDRDRGVGAGPRPRQPGHPAGHRSTPWPPRANGSISASLPTTPRRSGIYERSGFVRVGEPCPDLLLV